MNKSVEEKTGTSSNVFEEEVSTLLARRAFQMVDTFGGCKVCPEDDHGCPFAFIPDKYNTECVERIAARLRKNVQALRKVTADSAAHAARTDAVQQEVLSALGIPPSAPAGSVGPKGDLGWPGIPAEPVTPEPDAPARASEVLLTERLYDLAGERYFVRPYDAKAPEMTRVAPRFKHDCGTCQFLGHLYECIPPDKQVDNVPNKFYADIYACNHTILFRAGDDGPEYWSMDMQGMFSPALVNGSLKQMAFAIHTAIFLPA